MINKNEVLTVIIASNVMLLTLWHLIVIDINRFPKSPSWEAISWLPFCRHFCLLTTYHQVVCTTFVCLSRMLMMQYAEYLSPVYVHLFSAAVTCSRIHQMASHLWSTITRSCFSAIPFCLDECNGWSDFSVSSPNSILNEDGRETTIIFNFLTTVNSQDLSLDSQCCNQTPKM